jgi:hypothetical protein
MANICLVGYADLGEQLVCDHENGINIKGIGGLYE